MRFEISDEVRERATRCPHNFACLEDPDQVCPVKANVRDKVLFVRVRRRVGCPYSLSFGEDDICQCPVRRALYRRHQV